MRHAHASMVKVICRYQPESGSLLLEVHDNGCGIATQEAGRSTGKGLGGLRRRAEKLNGQLQIATKAQQGTFIRLLVPLHSPERAMQPAANPVSFCTAPDIIPSGL